MTEELKPASRNAPATDEDIVRWQTRPCLDSQCRCTELHLDQAIERIESDRAALASERKLRRELQARLEMSVADAENAIPLLKLHKAALARAAEHDAETGKEERSNGKL